MFTDFKLSTIDITIVFIYFILCILFGTAKKVRAKSIRDFAIGSGNVPLFGLVTMIFATYIGAGSTVGEVERIYTLGAFYAITRLLSPLFWLINAWIFADKIERFSNCISLSDIMEQFYGKFARKVTAVLSIFTCIGFVAAQVSALGFLSSYLLGIPSLLGVLISGSVVIIYIMVGGAKSIVVNDIFQFCIFYVAIPILCAIGLNKAGGLEVIINTLPSKMMEIDLSGIEKWVFISLICYALMPTTHAPLVQRFLMARNSAHLKKSMFYVAFLSLSFAITICTLGFVSIILVPDIEPSKALYYMISNYLPVGMIGLLISGLLAVIMSTAHSWLNTAAVVVSDDIAPYFLKNLDSKKKLFIARLATLFIMLFAIAVATSGKSVMGLLWLAQNVWDPVMMLPIIFGFKGLKTTPLTFKVSFFTATTVTLVTAYFRQDFDTLSLFSGIFSCLISFLAAHYIQQKRNVKIANVMKAIAGSLDVRKPILGFLSAIQNPNQFNTTKAVVFWGFIFFQYIPSMFEASLSGLATDPVQMILRSVPVLLVVVFMTHEYWAERVRAILMIPLWNITVFYTLAFNSALLLIINGNKMIWVINLVISAILLAALFNLKRAMIMLAMGIGAALFVASIYTFNPGYILLSDFNGLALASAYGAISIALILALHYSFSQEMLSKDEEIQYVAHEAKSPLASCSMIIDEVQSAIANLKFENSADAKISREDVSYIESILSRLQAIYTDGINAISHVVPNSQNNLEVVKICNTVAALLQKKSDPRIISEIDETLEFMALSNASLQVAIENILNNAIKHSEATEIRIYNKGSKLVVEDNGVGIHEEITEKIFTHGFTTNGSGYGLAIAKKIIEESGGSLELESAMNSYTRFIISLPTNVDSSYIIAEQPA